MEEGLGQETSPRDEEPGVQANKREQGRARGVVAETIAGPATQTPTTVIGKRKFAKSPMSPPPPQRLRSSRDRKPSDKATDNKE